MAEFNANNDISSTYTVPVRPPVENTGNEESKKLFAEIKLGKLGTYYNHKRWL